MGADSLKLLSVADEEDHFRVEISGRACRFHFLWLGRCSNFEAFLKARNRNSAFSCNAETCCSSITSEFCMVGIGHSVGARHLQGCYADRDGFLSTLRVLEKSEI